MSGDIAVIMDVAGTILKMYRVAKDIQQGVVLRGVVTWELIMQKKGRALVVPQVDPQYVMSCNPFSSLCTLFAGREEHVKITCASSYLHRNHILDMLRATKVQFSELQQVYMEIRDHCPNKYQTTGMIVDEDLQDISHVLSTGGTPFPGLENVLNELGNQNIDIYIASGDSKNSLLNLRDYGIDENRIFFAASPKIKRDAVSHLKKKYKQVVMVGDGLNDLFALEKADWGILTVQQDTHPPWKLRQAADRIIVDIRDLPHVINELCLS